MSKFPKNLQNKLAQRRQGNAFRQLSPKSGLADFSSNDYLGFAREKRITAMSRELLNSAASQRNGATGSRLLSGNHELYDRLEDHLPKWYDAQSALIFNSGYDANLGFFSTVPQRGDFILYDERCHASIRDGIRLSNATSFKFKHNDLHDLQDRCRSRALSRSKVGDKGPNRELYVVTESVFSMDGDSPNFPKLVAWTKGNNAHLVVDEAHAVGVFGKGIIKRLGLADAVFARTVTFGKALGVHGAAILGSRDLKDFLINFCRNFIYTTGLAPHTLATILAAHNFLDDEIGKKHSERLHENISYFKSEIARQHLGPDFKESNSAIQICTVRGNARAKKLSRILEKNGYDVSPILSPTVPKGAECLRFCLHAFNTKEEIKGILEVIKKNIWDEK